MGPPVVYKIFETGYPIYKCNFCVIISVRCYDKMADKVLHNTTYTRYSCLMIDRFLEDFSYGTVRNERR